MSSYVELFNLSKSYDNPAGRSVIVEGFNLNIQKGEFISILGHSGCGKTTVLSMVAGLTPKSGGGIIVGDREVHEAGPDRGVVFQAPCLLPWMTALENVQLGVNRVYPYVPKARRMDIASYYLELVGLKDSLHKRPKELSRGMQQRVGLARAFAISPKMLLLDEPFGMLDSLTRMELQEILVDLVRRKSMTAMMVTHDVDEALFLSDRIVLMTNGPAAKVGDVVATDFARPRVRSEVLEHPNYYTLRQRLLTFLEEQAPIRLKPKPQLAPATLTLAPAVAS